MKCQECGSTEFIRKGGDVYCKQCGLVVRNVQFSGKRVLVV
ncbi:MAG: hypothetical protein DRO96_00605 [Candidatus Aenigmatarchaeota archaeon]|nr:MAG: hypothetical protein DRO96_00605 [Candidatus Aenigmarchaeota archaeon]